MATRIFGFPGQYPSGSQNLIFGDLGSSYPANCFSGQPWRFFCLAPSNNCRSVSDKCFSLTSALCFLAADAKKAIWSSYEQIWEHLWISSRIYHNPCMFDEWTKVLTKELDNQFHCWSKTYDSEAPHDIEPVMILHVANDHIGNKREWLRPRDLKMVHLVSVQVQGWHLEHSWQGLQVLNQAVLHSVNRRYHGWKVQDSGFVLESDWSHLVLIDLH